MVVCLGLTKNIKIPCTGDVMNTCVNYVSIKKKRRNTQ